VGVDGDGALDGAVIARVGRRGRRHRRQQRESQREDLMADRARDDVAPEFSDIRESAN
jgi:hypothetical protein